MSTALKRIVGDIKTQGRVFTHEYPAWIGNTQFYIANKDGHISMWEATGPKRVKGQRHLLRTVGKSVPLEETYSSLYDALVMSRKRALRTAPFRGQKKRNRNPVKKKPRTAKQKAATKKLIAFNKARGRLNKRRAAPKRKRATSRKPARTAKQKAATRKLVALNKRRTRAPRRKVKVARRGHKLGWVIVARTKAHPKTSHFYNGSTGFVTGKGNVKTYASQTFAKKVATRILSKLPASIMHLEIIQL